jgi:hypothetical protein
VESELFGHVRGAFTGATQDKIGVFEYGNGGTLFFVRTLTNAGFEMISASDGEEGLRLALGTNLDIILLDMM